MQRDTQKDLPPLVVCAGAQWTRNCNNGCEAVHTMDAMTCGTERTGVNGVRSMLMDCTIPPGLPLPSPTSTFPGALFRLKDYS